LITITNESARNLSNLFIKQPISNYKSVRILSVKYGSPLFNKAVRNARNHVIGIA